MKTDDWRRVCPRRFTAPTMISAEEKQYLHWLGATVWSGAGHAVEVGPWLGGSTLHLAAGMQASPHDARGSLQTFDNFVWREFMSDRAALDLRPGDSFEFALRENIRELEDVIRVHKAALPDDVVPEDPFAAAYRNDAASWTGDYFSWDSGEPIEILFVDGAKSWLSVKHLLREVAGSLIPGKSLIVCQDYKYWEDYWIPLALARFESSLVPVHNVVRGNTVTFSVEGPLSEAVLSGFEERVAAIDTEWALAEFMRLAARLGASGDVLGAAALDLARVAFLLQQSDVDRAIACFLEVEARWPLNCDILQLERARMQLAERGHTLARRPRTWLMAGAGRVVKASRALATWLGGRDHA